MVDKIRGFDWKGFFTAMAFGIIMILQYIQEQRQEVHENDINVLTETKTDEAEVNKMIDSKTNELLQRLTDIEDNTLQFDKKWLEWQQENACKVHKVEFEDARED